MKGNLDVSDPGEWWQDARDRWPHVVSCFKPITSRLVYGLPPIHRDPFHRMLIGPAIAEDRRWSPSIANCAGTVQPV